MKTVAVIFGGKSTEHDVSIITALSAVIKPLELSKKYNVLPIYITKKGVWYSHPNLSNIELYRSGDIDNFLTTIQPLQLIFKHGLTIQVSKKLRAKNVKIDVVFPAMHGTNGEDGALMGLLEMAGVPYVGCGLASSVVAMDKVLAKQVATSESIPSTPWVWFYSRDLSNKKDEIIKSTASLKYPLFVKPAHLGSSIGITKVDKKEDLFNALEVAAHFDDKVIVEQGVANLIEVTLPIIGEGESIRPAMLERPLVGSSDFFDFDKKYLGQGKKGGKKMASDERGAQGYSQIPADIPKALYDKAVEVGVKMYQAAGCSGIARVDMLIDSTSKRVYFNEINPLPGSLYAHNWRLAGVSGVQLVEKLVTDAETKFEQKKNYETVFNTNFLKQF